MDTHDTTWPKWMYMTAVIFIGIRSERWRRDSSVFMSRILPVESLGIKRVPMGKVCLKGVHVLDTDIIFSKEFGPFTNTYKSIKDSTDSKVSFCTLYINMCLRAYTWCDLYKLKGTSKLPFTCTWDFSSLAHFLLIKLINQLIYSFIF